MGLLALQMQLDQIDQNPLKIAAELRGRLESMYFCVISPMCTHVLANA